MRQFLSVAEAARELDVSQQYVRNLIHGIQANTPQRYFVSDVFRGGKVAVRFVALMDYAAYRGNLKNAPAYRPVEREKELGITGGRK